MPAKSCSWAQIYIRQPNTRVVTFGEFEIMASKFICPMLTHWGVTLIEALCQAVHPFGLLVFCNHTLYRSIAFWQMIHFFASITFGCLFLFIDNALSLCSFHCRWSILSQVTLLKPSELATLDFPISTARLARAMIAYVAHFLLTFFPFQLAKPKISQPQWLIGMHQTYWQSCQYAFCVDFPQMVPMLFHNSYGWFRLTSKSRINDTTNNSV